MRLTLLTINNSNYKNSNCILFGPSILPHLGNSVPTLSLSTHWLRLSFLFGCLGLAGRIFCRSALSCCAHCPLWPSLLVCFGSSPVAIALLPSQFLAVSFARFSFLPSLIFSLRKSAAFLR